MEPTNQKKLYVLSGILAVLIVVFFVYLAVNRPLPQNGAGNEQEEVLPDLTKAEILAKTGSKEILSQTDKMAIMRSIAGGKINQYKFTPAEVKRIIEAVNKKK